ncbi:DUF2637 domain-containing protein [Solwaraspora sp. WMMD937]|uniref:DUF2637 domain-containing protein n=1 Tax=Solwaraspora sp. WMMD937 TaxID=3016090 RepID=UPI00249BC753|nr:DUF2637 domain-containing protein [Solwaraspora sp. WMMD937]WFE22787.1 DUF2637 domain-containing protein [Solwaraspora sp. WMMD937]
MTPTRIARDVSTVAVAGIAAWSSWSHMVAVALKFGERPEVAYVLPISVDGMLIVASTVMVDDRRAGRPVRWSVRIAFVAGVAASVAANIAAAQPTLGARIVAAWPAVALLLVVEMLSRARPVVHASLRRVEAEEEPGDNLGSTDSRDIPEVRLVARGSGLRPDPDQIRNEDRQVRLRRPPRSRRREDVERTTERVVRLRTERPDASLADIARDAGVSERHVRRLLASRTREG